MTASVDRGAARQMGSTTPADERRFCRCGSPFAGRRVRSCLGCGRPEPRRLLRVQEVDGRQGWAPVPAALARGGRA